MEIKAKVESVIKAKGRNLYLCADDSHLAAAFVASGKWARPTGYYFGAEEEAEVYASSAEVDRMLERLRKRCPNLEFEVISFEPTWSQA